jgi:hypothetical protein
LETVTENGNRDEASGGAPGAERQRLLRRLGAPAGLCATCAHLVLASSPRSVFVRCGLAASDPAFVRYPPLPVRLCPGHRPLPAGEPPAEPAG